MSHLILFAPFFSTYIEGNCYNTLRVTVGSTSFSSKETSDVQLKYWSCRPRKSHPCENNSKKQVLHCKFQHLLVKVQYAHEKVGVGYALQHMISIFKVQLQVLNRFGNNHIQSWVFAGFYILLQHPLAKIQIQPQKTSWCGLFPTHKVFAFEGSSVSYRWPNDRRRIGDCWKFNENVNKVWQVWSLVTS